MAVPRVGSVFKRLLQGARLELEVTGGAKRSKAIVRIVVLICRNGKCPRQDSNLRHRL
jgi:hypothetical protein